MAVNKIKGQIIGGSFDKVIIRQKSGSIIELGELLVSEYNNMKMIMQVYDLAYGSQISQQNLELVSGMNLEEDINLNFMDPNLRNYNIAFSKPLIILNKDKVMISKQLPKFFSQVRSVREEDIKFLTKPDNAIYIGKIRSGSSVLNLDVSLNGRNVLIHHILIAATTGRGKSNLVKVMLWDMSGRDIAGVLVLDPHDEYYGRNKIGLKDHPSKSVEYYTPKDAPIGTKTLRINIKNIKPWHFNGVADFSSAQIEALDWFYKKYNEGWIKNIFINDEEVLKTKFFRPETIAVIKRKLGSLLGIKVDDKKGLIYNDIFSDSVGEKTINDICNSLENGNIVIIDTSKFKGSVEVLIGSIIANEIMKRYRHYKLVGKKNIPISIVIEEAPRVLGKDVLERGPNIFGTIAREGRKFNIGLIGITQIPSLIPREILANMNTKIILGIEMAPERKAIIDSSSQDLSKDDRAIASLDKGEAIITSSFTKFAIPLKITKFDDFALKEIERYKKENKEKGYKLKVVGMENE